MHSVQDNKEVLSKIENVIYPLMLHGLTPDGLDSIEDVLDCIALVLYHGPERGISKNMWKLYP